VTITRGLKELLVVAKGQGSPILPELLKERSEIYLRSSLQKSPETEDFEGWPLLYAAIERLKKGIESDDLLDAVTEICSNLLACEELAIVEVSSATQKVEILRCTGITEEEITALKKNGPALAEAIRQGRIISRNASPAQPGKSQSLQYHTLVPISYGNEEFAAILLFRLLPQKIEFDSEDIQVLELLSVFVGPCLYHARLSGKRVRP
jgi:hypothetical protein